MSINGESQVGYEEQGKCPTDVLRVFRRHESVNHIWLKQTAKPNTYSKMNNEKTAEAIEKAEKDFSMDLPLLVDETARIVKILNAISYRN